MKDQPKYWIVVASKDHIQRGVEGGFIQAGHGKLAPLKRMQQHDRVLCYSPKQTLEGDEKCQAFTALGEVADEEIYQQKVSEEFIPYRRKVKFSDTQDTSIVHLIPDLGFIKNKKSWGFPFRMGFFEIQKDDFDLIRRAMTQQKN